jgi:tetratricopeptide (TPR) repeat protein
VLPDPSEPVGASDERSGYKRFVAVAAAGTALFGTVVVLLQAHSSVESGRANRDAQRDAAATVRKTVGADQSWLEAFGVWVEAEGYERLQTLAEEGAVPGAGGDVGRASTEADQWQRTHESLESVSPFVGRGGYAEAVDPIFPFGYFYDTITDANRTFIRQQVEQDQARRWGSRAGRLGAAVAVLAVALFLLGLSLTTSVALRPVLLIPAGLLLIFCLGITVRSVSATIPDVPDRAIADVAAGDRAMNLRDYDAALAHYDDALARAPRFAQAFAHRSNLWFVRGAKAPPGALFISWAPPADIDQAARDIDRAIALGVNDAISSNLEAALRIHQGRWREAIAAAERARDLNPANPLPWVNLGAALVAEGRTPAADAVFRGLIERIGDRPDAPERKALYAVTVSVLEVIAQKVPSQRAAAERFARHVERRAIGSELRGPDAAGGSVSGLSISFGPAGARLEYQNVHLPTGTQIATVWYRRERTGQPWSVEPGMTTISTQTQELEGAAVQTALPGWCAASGTYRVDVYIGGKVVASARATRKAHELDPLGYAPHDLGITMCRPLDWTAESVRGARLIVESPDRAQSVTVASYPAPGVSGSGALGPMLDLAVGAGRRTSEYRTVRFNDLAGVEADYETGERSHVVGRAFLAPVLTFADLERQPRVVVLLSRGHDAELLTKTFQVN